MNPKDIYLIQTDTTVGFSSSDDEKLSFIKKRPKTQKILRTVDSFDTLKKFTRIPNKYKRMVRNSKSKTFIYPNSESFRVVNKNSKFYTFIKKFNILYSSSANMTKKEFDEDFAKQSADIVVYTENKFFETKPSSIYKISNHRIKKLR